MNEPRKMQYYFVEVWGYDTKHKHDFFNQEEVKAQNKTKAKQKIINSYKKLGLKIDNIQVDELKSYQARWLKSF